MAKMVKKAQSGIVKSLKKAGADLKQADRDYKSSDSVRNLPIKSKSLKGKLDEMKGNRAKADSLFKVAKKREAGEMKNGGTKKKYKNGGTLSAPKKDGVSMQLGTYIRKIGKNYTGKKVVNKGAKAKMVKSVGKCKNGC